MAQEQGEGVVWGRMHESGLYFFCPRCSLSFPHPTYPEAFYRVGYGFCWYCFRRVPIEGGDRQGVVRVGADGELYTELYERTDGDDGMVTFATPFARWEYDERRAELARLCPPRKCTKDCDLCW